MSCSGFITMSTCSLVQVHCLTGDKLIAGTDSPKNLSELVHAVAEVFEYEVFSCTLFQMSDRFSNGH